MSRFELACIYIAIMLLVMAYPWMALFVIMGWFCVNDR